MEQEEKSVESERNFADAFGTSTSGSGEEELLRVAASFSRQLRGDQMKILLRLDVASRDERIEKTKRDVLAYIGIQFMEYKQFNQSREYVAGALGAISLRKFINSDAFKVNVMK